MSRLPRSFWLGSSTSPLAMTSSYFSAGSAGSKPRGAGAPVAWATSTGVWALGGAGQRAAGGDRRARGEEVSTRQIHGCLLSAQAGAAPGDEVEEARDLDVQEVDVGREEPPAAAWPVMASGRMVT